MILDIIAGLFATITALNGHIDTLAIEGNYARYRVADSCYVETLNYSDSVLVVETVCAPRCSSHARIYNKEGELIRTIPSPYPNAVLVEGHIEDGTIVWTDNTWSYQSTL